MGKIGKSSAQALTCTHLVALQAAALHAMFPEGQYAVLKAHCGGRDRKKGVSSRWYGRPPPWGSWQVEDTATRTGRRMLEEQKAGQLLRSPGQAGVWAGRWADQWQLSPQETSLHSPIVSMGKLKVSSGARALLGAPHRFTVLTYPAAEKERGSRHQLWPRLSQ